MDNESDIQSADEDRIHEDLLNRAIAPFMTENGVNVPADHGLLVLADDKAGDVSVPFIIPTADKIDVIIDIFSRITSSESTVAPEVMVSGVLSDCINDFHAAHDKKDDDAWLNLTSSVVTLLLGLQIQQVDKEKVVTGLSDSQRDNTLPVLYGHAVEGMLTTGLIYISREPAKAIQ